MHRAVLCLLLACNPQRAEPATPAVAGAAMWVDPGDPAGPVSATHFVIRGAPLPCCQPSGTCQDRPAAPVVSSLACVKSTGTISD